MLHTAGYLRLGPRAVRADMAERLMAQISQIRRGSETSAFVIPPELAAQVGSPAADFPLILRALGLKPAEKDKETGAIKLWRFPAQRKSEPAPARPRNGHPPKPAPPPSGPFAVLAELIAPPAPPRQHRRRRRPKRPTTAAAVAPAPKAAS
jgi:ATP-dependent RNA helicase SUPV3L1/SUV3